MAVSQQRHCHPHAFASSSRVCMAKRVPTHRLPTDHVVSWVPRASCIPTTNKIHLSRANSRPAPLHRASVVHCSASSSMSTRIQLPIFPLNIVAVPGGTYPLMIFEARYRVLFSTLLVNEPGVEQGLVQADSPFHGSKRFGMVFADAQGRLATVGTVLEVVECAHAVDGRIFVTCKGRERFRILDILKENPVLVCEVEGIREEEDDAECESQEAHLLASSVRTLLRRTFRLNHKVLGQGSAAATAGGSSSSSPSGGTSSSSTSGSPSSSGSRGGTSSSSSSSPSSSHSSSRSRPNPIGPGPSSNPSSSHSTTPQDDVPSAISSATAAHDDDEQALAKALDEVAGEGLHGGPRALSFCVAALFQDVKVLQQRLLEEGSTIARLAKEKEVLEETVRYFSAAAALKSLFAEEGGRG